MSIHWVFQKLQSAIKKHFQYNADVVIQKN